MPGKRFDFGPALQMVAGALFLMFPAFINGYPLIYSDTSTYLHSGFILQPPLDRPITYGLYIRLASLNGITLWTVVFTQTLILSALLYDLTKLGTGIEGRGRAGVFALIILASGLSGASWTTTFLLPDIFASIMLLSAVLLFCHLRQKRSPVLLWIIFGLAAAMHASHLPFAIAILACIALFRLLSPARRKVLFPIRALLIILGITLLTIPFMSTSLSKSKHVFQMGAFIEQGIIETYLDQECESKEYALCAYKDSLPDQAWQFIWEEESPLYKLGGWKATKTEFNEIIRDTWTTPRYFVLHLKTSFLFTMQQLLRFKSVYVHGVSPNIEELGSRIEEFVPLDLRAFQNSRQNTGPLTAFAWLNPLQLALVLLSLVLIPGRMIWKSSLRRNEIVVLIGGLLILGIVVHAWICGTFANPIDRLGNKMIWLLPAYATLLFFQADSK